MGPHVRKDPIWWYNTSTAASGCEAVEEVQWPVMVHKQWPVMVHKVLQMDLMLSSTWSKPNLVLCAGKTPKSQVLKHQIRNLWHKVVKRTIMQWKRIIHGFSLLGEKKDDTSQLWWGFKKNIVELHSNECLHLKKNLKYPKHAKETSEGHCRFCHFPYISEYVCADCSDCTVEKRTDMRAAGAEWSKDRCL